jgi:hypothetical protein
LGKLTWTERDKHLLVEAYQLKRCKGVIPMSEQLLERHNRQGCTQKAKRMGLSKKIHNCWEKSRIIKNEMHKVQTRTKKKTGGVWRYRECKICGRGWETLETKCIYRAKKYVWDGRLRPLSAGWKP